MNSALSLQPELPEVHLTCARHLYLGYRDYDRARVQLAIAKRGLPNNVEAIHIEARIYGRQGDFEKAIQELNEAVRRGLLGAKAARMESYTENNVSVITEQCKAFADQALKDVAAFASDMLE